MVCYVVLLQSQLNYDGNLLGNRQTMNAPQDVGRGEDGERGKGWVVWEGGREKGREDGGRELEKQEEE